MTVEVDVNQVLVGIIVILIGYGVYGELLRAKNDINPIYLSEQSNVDSTRLAHESPIYKSNKLEYGGGLRIGLDIRYDHYKIRHGNLSDIWAIAMKNGGKHVNDGTGLTINGKVKSFAQLNYHIDKFKQFLNQYEIKSLKINQRLFLGSFDIFVILISSFLNQTTIEFYDNYAMVENEDNQGWVIVDDEERTLINHTNYLNIDDQSVYDLNDEKAHLSEFSYDYNPNKDKGICIKLIGKSLSGNPTMISTIEFTQLNIISAIASTLKHLPPNHQLSPSDTLLIMQPTHAKFSSLINELVKILTGLTTNAKVFIDTSDELNWDVLTKIQPTVVSINSGQLSVTPFTSQLNHYQRVVHHHNLKSLQQGRFPQYGWEKVNKQLSNLRLIYISEPINSSCKFTFQHLNEFRSVLNARIISEFNYYNVATAIIHSDFYDYRLFTNVRCKSWGCISQSLEIKLINIDDKSKVGEVMIRGYTIGKTTNKFSTSTQYPDDSNGGNNGGDGFMPLVNVRGKWGNDGCLYIV